MTVLRMVECGVDAANAAVESAFTPPADGDAVGLTRALLAHLRAEVPEEELGEAEAALVGAYRDWLDAAVHYYGLLDGSGMRELTRTTAVLSAEIHLADLATPAAEGDGDDTT